MTRGMLLNQLDAVQFAMWELHLYLDTHPGDIGALKLYKKYEEKNQKLTEEYEENFGPLFSNADPGVSWLKNPWPWDLGGNR
ncbi:MAG: spore coat protein CotJB [Clostridia bacterium]|nr:spore coat protein CotJB [Clostridia bacterium]